MLNIELLKQALKIEVIEKKSFGDNIADILNPQYFCRYDLLEWYFHQLLLEELVDGHKVLSYRNSKITAFDGLLKQLFPSAIFQRTMIDYLWHYLLRRLESTYPLEFKQFINKLHIYEKYVLLLRRNGEKYIKYINQQREKLKELSNQFTNEENEILIEELKYKSKNSDEEKLIFDEAKKQRNKLKKFKNNVEKQLEGLEKLNDLVEGKIWPSNQEIQSLLKVVELDSLEKDFNELAKLIAELIDFPIVHDLINMSSTSCIPLWLANVGATCRLNNKLPYSEDFTDAEIAKMKLTLESFNKYDKYQALFTGEWDPSLDVKNFVNYYAKEQNLIKKIAIDFTPEQQVVAFKQLMKLDESAILERLLKEPEFVTYFETMLRNAVIYVEDQAISKFRQQLTLRMTTHFIEESILQKESFVWLTLIEPERLFHVLTHKHSHDQLQLLNENFVRLLQLDWSSLKQIGQETYCKYWEFLFESRPEFRLEVLSNPVYIVEYYKKQGNNQAVWNWLQNNAFQEQYSFTTKPIVDLDYILKKIGKPEQVNKLMAKWGDDSANFDVLREMNFTIVTGDEEGFVPASSVLQSSMLFELEDEMLTDKFENYQFAVKRVGMMSPDGTILRRTKIKAQLLVDEVEDLDDWLSSLENL